MAGLLAIDRGGVLRPGLQVSSRDQPPLDFLEVGLLQDAISADSMAQSQPVNNSAHAMEADFEFVGSVARTPQLTRYSGHFVVSG
jgi:hypothetical protein